MFFCSNFAQFMNQTALRILNTAGEKFMRYGIRSVSMDDIASDLGMSKKTLYEHFRTKRKLVEEVSVRFIEMDKQAMLEIREKASDALDEMVRIARYVSETLQHVPQTTLHDLKKYYQGCWHHFDQFHKDFIYQTIYENIERGIAEGVYRADINADIMARLYIGKSILITDQDLFPLNKYPTAVLFKQFIMYHIYGLASAKGLKQLNKYLVKQKI
jgi:AcrR family transcriptional regulator